jgi:hypothetical protein
MSAIQEFQDATEYVSGPLDANEHSLVPSEWQGVIEDAISRPMPLATNFITLSRELREPPNWIAPFNWPILSTMFLGVYVIVVPGYPAPVTNFQLAVDSV